MTQLPQVLRSLDSADDQPVRVPFNRPHLSEEAAHAIGQCLNSSVWSGDGPFTKEARRRLREMLGVADALLTPSGTAALEMMAMLLDLAPGDEVIVPAFTFVSTANAFALMGAKPIFCDVRPDTLNIDESKLEALIGPRTRAVVTVHYGGIACAMDAICQLASRHNITVLEDNAHGLFGTYRGKPLGSFGALSALSFHETKNIPCGEGGCLVVNQPALIERAEIIREKGTDRSRFWRGEIDKYTWRDLGSSYLLSDILSAILVGQLDASRRTQETRHSAWNRYRGQLSGWAEDNNVRLPHIPEECEHPAHIFYMVLPNNAAQRSMLRHLKSAGITAVSHYVALNDSPFGRKLGGSAGQCPVAESSANRIVRLPLFNSISVAEVDLVVEAVKNFQTS